MGILDQISILRSPATADLKQDQYSTILVQLIRPRLQRFTIFGLRSPQRGLKQTVESSVFPSLAN